MQIENLVRGDTSVLQLHGKFDYLSSNAFNRSVNHALNHAQTAEIEVDLDGVHYIDASACGMLLMLRSKALETGKSVSLARASGDVRQALSELNMKRLFAMR